MQTSMKWVVLGMLIGLTLTSCGPSERERALAAEASALQDRINELEVTLSERSDAARQLQDALEAVQRERDAARDDLQEVRNELQAADASQVNEDRAGNPAATVQQTQLDEQNQRLEAQLAAADIQLQAAQTRANTLETQNRDLTERLTRLRTGADRIETGLGDALEQLSQLEQTRQRARAQADGNEAALDAQEVVVERLQSDLQAARSTVAELRAELNVDETTRASDVPPALQQALARVTELEAEREEAENRLRDLEDQRVALQSRLDASEAELEALQLDVRAAVENETQGLRQERDSALADLQAAEARARELTDALAEAQEAQDAQDGRVVQALQVALVEAQGDVARLANARGVYTVQAADSLSSIATFFYRNGNMWPSILEANDHLIDDPDLIFSGMVLVVPEVR